MFGQVHLTLTRAVFELTQISLPSVRVFYLTLTRVVFELRFICYTDYSFIFNFNKSCILINFLALA